LKKLRPDIARQSVKIAHGRSTAIHHKRAGSMQLQYAPTQAQEFAGKNV
jgi:hypothetical protein